MNKITTPYHHGDLRNALLDAADELLQEQGLQGFTLRACARRAGVSHMAPKHHFNDVRGLLRAVAERGFARLVALLKERFDGTVKVSLRASGDVDVQAIAGLFGGGGHKKAAGATMLLSLADAERELERAIQQALSAAAPNGPSA